MCIRDSHHLVDRAGTQYLDTQQPAALPVGHQLGNKLVRTGIIMCLVIGDADHTDRVDTLGLCLCLGQAGTADIEVIEQTDHTGTETARIPRCLLYTSRCV